MAAKGEYWLTIVPDTSKLEAGIREAADGIDIEPPVKPKVDKPAAEKAGKDATEAVKVEPKVEPKVDKPAAEKAGKEAGEAVGKGAEDGAGKAASAIGSILGEVVGTAVGKAGAAVEGELIKAVRSDGIVGGIGKMGRDIGAVASKAGDALRTSLTKSAIEAAPQVAEALGKGMSKIGDKIKASSAGRDVASAAWSPRMAGILGGAAAGAGVMSGKAGAASNLLGSVGASVGNAQNQLANFDAALENTQQLLGGGGWAASGIDHLQGVLAGLAPAMTGVGSAAMLAQSAVSLFSGVSKAASAVQWAFNAALTANPIGVVVAAIGAVVAGLTLFFTKTELGKRVWSSLVDAFKATVGVVKEVFGHITSAIGGVVTWIKDHWKLLPILAGPVGVAISLVLTHWDRIKAGATAVWEWVSGKFTAMVGFIKGLPGKIADAAKGMWDGLKSGLAAVLNWIADKWNAFADVFKFDIGPIHSPGLPKMPHFQAKAAGGLLNGPGTGTSDSMLIRASHGEFVVNAAATAANLPLLSMVNAGTPLGDILGRLYGLPRFEGGGHVGGLTAHASEVKGQIQQIWPQITNIGGYRAPDGYNEHSTGNALDVMIPNWQTPEGKALGDAIAGWAIKNSDALGLNWVIWRQATFNGGSGGAGTPMADRGSPTQNHMDHVHIFMNKAPNPKVPMVGPAVKSPSAASGGSGAAGGGSASAGTGGGTGGTGGGSGGDGSGDGGDVLSQLGEIGKAGLRETLLGGTGLSDPMDWPNVKSAMAGLDVLLKFLKKPIGGRDGGAAAGPVGAAVNDAVNGAVADAVGDAGGISSGISDAISDSIGGSGGIGGAIGDALSTAPIGGGDGAQILGSDSPLARLLLGQGGGSQQAPLGLGFLDSRANLVLGNAAAAPLAPGALNPAARDSAVGIGAAGGPAAAMSPVPPRSPVGTAGDLANAGGITNYNITTNESRQTVQRATAAVEARNNRARPAVRH